MRKPADPLAPRRLYAPLAPLAIGLAAGVVVDRFGLSLATSTWAMLAVAAGVIALVRPANWLLFLAFAMVGGGWHHQRWNDLAADDLARDDWVTPRPAWLRGTIVEGPHHYPEDAAHEDGSTRLVLDTRGASDGERWHAASGRILVYINGNVTNLACGDAVFAAGTIEAIFGPRNPGETDRRDRLRADGIRLRMSVKSPESAWPDPDGSPDFWSRWVGSARERSQSMLVSGLDPDVSALGAALLLGRREAVDPDLNDAFARTGTTHLLAISGLHLQALAQVLFWLFLIVGMPWKRAYLGVLIATLLYAALVGFAPSVTRSVAMTILVCAGGLGDRCSTLANRLALAALITMAINPSHLFDAGCQLSFLAVMVLFWGVPAVMPKRRVLEPDDHATPKARIDALERKLEPPWKPASRRFAWRLVEGLVASVVVWAAAIPLVALWFHTVSPIGILLNLPLIPLTTLALFCAGFTLLASMVWAPLGYPSGYVCGVLLRWTMAAVNWGASVRGGWIFTPGPSLACVLLLYGLLAMASWATFRRWAVRLALWGALAIASVVVLGMVLYPDRPATLEADVLAVDHGLCVIVQGTDGRVIVYDCGKMRDPKVGRRVIAPALWSRGVSQINTLILSHADSDHYNGLTDLLDRFSLGEVRVPPGFGGKRNPEAERLLETVRARHIPIRGIAAGDRLDLGGGRIDVLHPPRGWDASAPDNAGSVVANVVDVNGGHGLLLTGDLDGVGSTEFAARSRPAFAAMLAPHHGGRTANPGWLYAWAVPRRVIVSQKRPASTSRDPLAMLGSSGVVVDRTWKTGAVKLKIGRPVELPRPMFAMMGPVGVRAIWMGLGLVLGLAICAISAIVEWGAWTLVMPGRRLLGSQIEPTPWEPVEVVAKDGAKLHGACLRRESPLGTVLFLHGFGEDRTAMRGRAEALHHRGWTVAVLDARGRGRSEGDRTAFGGREADDLRAWLDVLNDHPGPILAWGRSMGAAIAARAAVEDSRISAVILEAPYADLRDAVAAWIARMHLPRAFALPILWRAERLAGVSLHEPRPIDVAPRVDRPVLILHGTDDSVVPPADVRRLAGAFPGAVQVIEIDGAKHGDVFDRGGEELIEQIAAWAARPG